MEQIYSLANTAQVAQEVFSRYHAHRIWTFPSPMGSGKTTFIAALCKTVLACGDAVGSPTYSIINEYFSPKLGSICHMDWYRLKSEEEAIDAGVEEAMYTHKLCLIEWPSVVPQLLPTEYLEISISFVTETERLLKVQLVHQTNQ